MNTLSNSQYREILFQHFEKKKIRNTRYSLRAFARDLDVPVSRLSDVFTGKKNPSLPMANHLADKLGLTLLQRDLFITSVQISKEKCDSKKAKAQEKFENISKKVKNQWTLEEFEHISQWLDLSICVALSLENPPRTVEQVAELFGVCVEDAKKSIEKLVDRKEIIPTEGGWVAAEASALTPEDVPSSAIKAFHAQMMTKGKMSLMSDPIEVRDFSNLVFSFNSRDLPLLKKRLAQVRDQLMMEFGQSKECDSVYDLSMMLFPISKAEKSKDPSF